ncbi:MAG: hypothetical protein ACLGSA_15420 [Acidobacteriota bacterium]
MSDFLTPADLESILNDSRWSWPAEDLNPGTRCATRPQSVAAAACHEINFRGGRRWMTDERPGRPPWWRFWE